jgi:hypothetical protein
MDAEIGVPIKGRPSGESHTVRLVDTGETRFQHGIE